ncbi:MAG TPA: NADP-dependent malic enzyme [Clostridiales bacterium]|nr:NADP-dependent malic enzyme [Clostridiales bacterium]
MKYNEESLKLHEIHKGKIEVKSKVKINTREDLSLAYTPGVAEPCRMIAKNDEDIYKYTSKGNLIAVVTDGSAVLGLGNIGPKAALPVMEGKAILFKEFANVDAIPICIDSQDIDVIVNTVKLISPGFGGINLEDISAPRCFEIEERLKKELDIPVFHDDQHGTAVVVLAGVINALKVAGKRPEDVTAVVNGPGAAGIAISKLLIKAGIKDIILCGRRGILNKDDEQLDPVRKEIAAATNKTNKKGSLKDAMVGSDIFIGVSAPDVVTKDMVAGMNENAIVFAMANPIPEIMPNDAKAAGAKVVGTGRSDFPNQINNVLAFPGIFRGALDAGAKEISEEMKLAAAYAIAGMISDDELNEDYVIPGALDKNVSGKVAQAVAKAAKISTT